MESRPLSSSHDAYLNAFQAYIANSTVRETMKNYSCEAADHIMQNLTDSVKNSPIFRVLGVGSGDGKHDIEILKIVAGCLRSSHVEKPLIHTCIVEPSSPLIADFQRSVSPLPESLGSLADVSFEWRETRFEDFICSSLSRESEHYHLAHFICSLYYMDAEESLRNCFKELADGGAMFYLIAGENSYFTKLAHHFVGKLKHLSMSKFYTGKDVAAIAERNKWKYEELPKVQYEVDITSCFEKSSQTGSLLLDFLTHQIDFQGTAGQMLYNEVMDYLTESCTSDSNGRKILTTEFAIVIIYK
ncbi:histamine N-methyltransferase-like [Oculina patagonica]